MADRGINGYSCLAVEKLRDHMTALLKEKDGVIAAADHEYLHRMRVASRRVRRALDVFYDAFDERDSKAWLSTVKSLTKVLGSARDLDVQIEFLDSFILTHNDIRIRPGVDRLRLRFLQSRTRQQKKILRFFNQLEQTNELLRILRTLDTVATQCRLSDIQQDDSIKKYIGERIRQRLTEFLTFERYVNDPSASEELHAMRIAAKFLRYEMELFDSELQGEFKPYIQVVKKAQDVLGLLHDCDVWLQQIPVFLEKEARFTERYLGTLRGFTRIKKGLHVVEQERKEARIVAFHDFTEYWKYHTEQNTWENLCALVDSLQG